MNPRETLARIRKRAAERTDVPRLADALEES